MYMGVRKNLFCYLLAGTRSESKSTSLVCTQIFCSALWHAGKHSKHLEMITHYELLHFQKDAARGV